MNRIVNINDVDEAKYHLNKISVSSQGIELMALKAVSMIVKITAVKLGAANILKQEMLSIGGDAAVARGVVNGKALTSDVILLGNIDKIKKLIKKLKHQTIFDLPEICNDLERFLADQLKQSPQKINCRGHELSLNRINIQGILNITPDSFSDGAQYNTAEKALVRALQMIDEGADIIDVGGESTRPGAEQVTLQEELDRVIPVIEAISRETDIPISIDTYKSQVAEEALKSGCSIVNDISALRFDPKMIELLAGYKDVPIILMHMQGTPKDMQKNPTYDDVIDEVSCFLKDRIQYLKDNNIAEDRIIVDPGVGFGKRHVDNLTLLNEIKQFKSLGVPVLLGASRKSFIDRIYRSKADERLEGSLATTAIAWNNDIQFIRVHDVASHRKFLDVLESTRSYL